jgi:hypothetical protein
LIAEVFYRTAVPTGRLPFDLLTHTFITEAERRVADLSYNQHLAMYLFKKRLLRVLPGKIINYPECALFYVRTVIEIHLHMFMAKDYIGVARQFPSVVMYLKQYRVAEKY